jgi:uncharacterized membrane protein HdeD (DUF308 family)
MDWQSLFFGVFALLSGVPMLIFPKRRREAAQAKWATRVAEIDSGAEETFFEERRSLLAYPPYPTDRKWRIVGALFVAMGVALIALAIWR